MNFKSNLLQILNERGFYNQSTHEKEIDDLFSKEKITIYIGFDCTAKSLHVGSLMQIMVMRILQRMGHEIIVLLGGATTKIGDPSGKDEARQLLNYDEIDLNIAGIKKTLEKFDQATKNQKVKAFKFLNNDDWLNSLNYIDFLREFGRHFSINRMLNFDSVKLRLQRQQSLSFLEFNYMILQSYDFYQLNLQHNCTMQIGGSDQWGNIVGGVELVRRVASLKGESKEVFGLTTPLLTTNDGKKMGKTAKGAVWLDQNLLDEFEYFQYFRNIDDKEVNRFLKLFTEIEQKEIEEIQKKDINEQKKILAYEATKICHGEDKANSCIKKAEKIFSQNDINDLPQIILNFDSQDEKKGKILSQILKDHNICSSIGEARRLIKGGAIKINDTKIDDEFFIIDNNLLKNNIKLTIGKKKFFKLVK